MILSTDKKGVLKRIRYVGNKNVDILEITFLNILAMKSVSLRILMTAWDRLLSREKL